MEIGYIDGNEDRRGWVKEVTYKYQGIFYNSHTPMLIINPGDGQIKDANMAACSYYGYPREKFLSLNISDINMLNEQEILEEMERARTEDRKYFQFRHRLSNGDVKDVEVYSGPVDVENETLLFSIIHDIGEKKEIEYNYNIQNSYFIGLFENSPEAIAIVNNEFKIIKINRSFEKIFLYTMEEVRDRNITDVLCDQSAYNESSYIKDSIKRGEFVRKESLRRRKDGTLIPVSILSYPVVSNGKEVGIYCTYSDMSKLKEEKKAQEREVQKYLNLLKDTIDSIPDVIAVVKPDLTVELINKSGCRCINVTVAKIKGMNISELIEDKAGHVGRYIAKVIETKKAMHGQEYLQDKGRYIDYYCSPILDENGELILIVVRLRDITKEKRYQKDLMSAREKAEEASRLKTQFIANMSHEIRTPMNGIIGIIDFLKDTVLSNEQREYIEVLNYSADRLMSIINDILDVSKIEAGKLELRLEEFSVNRLLDNISRYFKLEARRKGLELVSAFDSKIPDTLIGDFDRLNQVLFNLLGNAVKFTEAGHVRFDAKLMNQDIDNVEIKFSIKDTGIGIPERKIDKLFSNFTQLDSSSSRKYGGTGLGLVISQRLVELMGGRIHVLSEHGRGSTFWFSIKIPVAKQSYETEANSVKAGHEVVIELPEVLNILAAEDESINQKIIKNLLEKWNCKVTIASNGQEVLRKLKDEKYDIIFMDLHMPEIDGYETTETIRTQERDGGGHIPIIGVTAAAAIEDKEKCLTIGMDDYISKPITKGEVYSSILRVLGIK